MHRKRRLYGHRGRRHAVRRVGRGTTLAVSLSLLALTALIGWSQT